MNLKTAKTARVAAVAAMLALPGAAVWFAPPAVAQEEAAAAEESGSDADGAEEPGGGADAADETDGGMTEEEQRLSELVGAGEEGASGDYEQEEDDDFVPTQEVSSDQSVNFPVDI
ncbi:MAG: hypothetical protein GVY21_02115 [Gammaproteobacteria bacterium]|nr:hypothetical protein [Gammaproteobacteria bacterium]